MFEKANATRLMIKQAAILAPHISTISRHMRKHCAYCDYEVPGDLQVKDFLQHLISCHQYLLTPEEDIKFHKLLDRL